MVRVLRWKARMASQLDEGLRAYFSWSETNGQRATIRQMVQIVDNGKKFLQSRKKEGTLCDIEA